MINKIRSDQGFSGYTHALSGVAGVFVILALAPIVLGDEGKFSVGNFWVLLGFSLAVIGGTLIPDLDNTSSTSRNSLGIVGIALSTVFRVSSVFMQTVIRTKRDDPDPNPHRGFWHTGVSAILIGGIVFWLSSISTSVSIPMTKVETLGDVFATVFMFLAIHLTLEVFAKKALKKVKSMLIVGEIIAFAVSLSLSAALMHISKSDSYMWLGIAYAIGCLIHVLGDSFTKYGTPLFFPITAFTRGKFWWNTRFAKMESGGDFEKTAVTAVLYVIIGIAMVAAIVSNFTQ